MEIEKELIELYSQFLTEVKILSDIDIESFVNRFKDTNSIRVWAISKAIQIKSEDEAVDDIPSPLRNLVSDFSSKINIEKEDGGMKISSNDPLVGRILTELDVQFKQNNKQSEYIGVFKITNFTNLIEMTLTSLTSWSLSYFETTNDSINDQPIKLEEMEQFSSIKELRNFALTKYVKGMTYQSAKKWITELSCILDNKLKNNNEFKKSMPYVIELYLRRNICVHNAGKVNSIYLSQLPAELKSEYNIDLNEHVNVDEKYISLSFSQGVTLINSFFLNRIEHVIEKIKGDEKRLESFFDSLNNFGTNLYNQNFFSVGQVFFKRVAKLAEQNIGENKMTVFFLYYNHYLGLSLSEKTKNIKPINKLFTYSKKQAWWSDLTESTVLLAETSLLKDPDEFCDTAITVFEKLKEGDDDEKKELANIMLWPMLKHIESNDKWIKFIDRLYGME